MITDKAHPSQYAFIGDALPQTSVATVPIHYESRLAKLEGIAEVARELTYCLCTLCERNKPWREALACKDLGDGLA